MNNFTRVFFIMLFCSGVLFGQNRRSASVSLDALNALYLGIDNHITIAIADVPSENLIVKINPGIIEGENGKYIAKIYKKGTATIDIYNKETLVESREFKCLFIPSPAPYLGELTGNTNSKRENLISAGCITVAIPNFLLDLKFKVVSFSMIVNVLNENNSISKEVSLNSNSACITNEMKEYILNPNIESTINFDDIKVECPDGSTRRINNRITIRLTDEILNKLNIEKRKAAGQNAEIMFKEKQIVYQNTKMKKQASVLNKQNNLMLIRKNEIIAHEKEITKQKKILSNQVVKIESQKTILAISLVVIFVICSLMIFSIRSYLKKKEINLKLAGQNIIIAEKNSEITGSINYAQRIQRSMLPPIFEVEAALPKSFILYKPKDIVSGDFYWFSKSDEKILIAAADCTGHGVPGAFMSAIGSEKLNEAALQTDDVSAILQTVNIRMKKVLHQSNQEDSSHDGMDIAICAFNKEMTRLEYAGANRPIWIVRNENNVIEETKATKVAIGGHTVDNQNFTKHEIVLERGDTVYMFSDGFADQFSLSGKKLMAKKFKEIILAIIHKSMDDQKAYLDSFIEEWKGDMEQTDDILVIGVRV